MVILRWVGDITRFLNGCIEKHFLEKVYGNGLSLQAVIFNNILKFYV